MPTHALPASCDDIAAQAADWIVQLTADDEKTRARACSDFEAWKRQDVRHAQAAAKLQGVLDSLDAISSTSKGHTRPAHTAIRTAISDYKTSRRIKKTTIAIAMVCLCAMPVWMLSHTETAHSLMADMRTATGQRQTQTLSDGTKMTLGSQSAVDISFDAVSRTVNLVTGEILVEVAKDPLRPFVINTREGSIRALGTRFVVERQDEVTTLTMLESAVVVQTAEQKAQGSKSSRVVKAGEQIRITTGTINTVTGIDTREVNDAWQFGQLVVRNRPLTDVLDLLSKHRQGYISYDRDRLAGIMMSVVLPIDDTDKALQLIANSLPDLRIRMLTPYFVYVDRTLPP